MATSKGAKAAASDQDTQDAQETADSSATSAAATAGLLSADLPTAGEDVTEEEVYAGKVAAEVQKLLPPGSKVEPASEGYVCRLRARIQRPRANVGREAFVGLPDMTMPVADAAAVAAAELRTFYGI